MEPVASSSLPPGLVRTAFEIFDEVASYPILPPEKIREYWNAYTTGFRMMVDPIAARLENFWWHVWGSDRRYLPGPVLARLFKEVALGPTFVPLARYWKPPLTRKATSDQSHGQQQKSGPSSPKSPEAHACSSSKAPQAPRPILKKNRGPSASGPRPTARFVDPPAPDDGNAGDRNASAGTTAAHQQAPSSKSQEQENAETQAKKPQDISTSSTAKAEPGLSNEMPPPPKPASKRRTSSTPVTREAPGKDMRPPRQTSPAGGAKAALPTGRKIVVPTAATRRRPMMPRRQSSQSSTGSPTIRLVGPVGAALKQAGTRRPSTDSKGSQEAVVAEPSETSENNFSAKAVGKRPVREPSQRNPPKASSPSCGPSRASNTQDKAVQTDDQLGGAGVQFQASGGSSAVSPQELPQTRTKTRQTQVIRGFNVPHQRPRLRENASQADAALTSAQSTQNQPPVAGFVADTQQRTSTWNTSGNLSQQQLYESLLGHPHPTRGFNHDQTSHPQHLPNPPIIRGPLPGQEHQAPLPGHPFPIGDPGNFAQRNRPQGLPDFPMMTAALPTLEHQALLPRRSEQTGVFRPTHLPRPQGFSDAPIIPQALPNQERQLLSPRPPRPAEVLNPTKSYQTMGLPNAPASSGALTAPGRAQTSRYPPTASREYPPAPQRQPMGLDGTHVRSRSLQRPSSTARSMFPARRRSSMESKPSKNGENQPETQTLQRPPPMAAFIPKHPPGTPLKDRIRSHIDLMSSTSAAGVTTTHASGRIGSDTLIYPDTLPEAHDLPDSVKYAKPALPSVLEPKFKPTPRNPAPPIPYGRSKSELFLLLEKINGNSGKDSTSSRPPI